MLNGTGGCSAGCMLAPVLGDPYTADHLTQRCPVLGTSNTGYALARGLLWNRGVFTQSAELWPSLLLPTQMAFPPSQPILGQAPPRDPPSLL